jgi:hypothetical protein
LGSHLRGPQQNECIGVAPVRLVNHGEAHENDESARLDVAAIRRRILAVIDA